ncbi:MAG: hypothetical protein EHM57_05900 [Actinobacteria bacterium]|nr:MAG: hypothetical protein EHM57_05900 [Actinomycetota bacterium]
MTEPKDRDNWAKPVERLHVGDVDAPKGNVEGRRVNTAMHGFGQMWQKTYRVSIPETSPEEIVATWKARFGEFWPKSNKFYPPPAGIAPGEVAVIAGGKGPTKLSTGVLVMYADATSFAYMTPEGHPFAGTIIFSSHTDDEHTTAQVALLIRNNDPIYELGFKLYTSRLEDRMWQHTLRSLAGAYGVEDADVETEVVCIDPKRQWDRFGNIYKNSALRTLLRRDRKG